MTINDCPLWRGATILHLNLLGAVGGGGAGNGLNRQRQLCVKTNLSMQKEALSFHSRSQNVKMLGRVLAGKVKRAEGKDGRGKSEGQGPWVSTLTV